MLNLQSLCQRLVAGAAALTVLVGAGTAIAASPVQGSIAGPVTAVKGQVFTAKTSQSPTGSSKVQVRSTTTIMQQSSGSRSDLKTGSCAMATGTRNKKGVVAATNITLMQVANGRCGGGFGQRRPPQQNPPGGATQPPSGTRPPANLGIASGTISSVKGSTLTLKDTQGTSTVTFTSKTQITRNLRVSSSAIRVKLCAFVFGTSSDKGVTVAAQTVNLSQPGTGGCTARFRRP